MLATLRNAALAAIPAALLASGAVAAPVPNYGEVRTVEVRYGDINLASDAGAAQLARRVNIAVTKVCGTADTRDLAANRLVKICRRETMANTTPRVETALAAARSDTRLAQTGGAPTPSLLVAAH